jgi:hypothetical protein
MNVLLRSALIRSADKAVLWRHLYRFETAPPSSLVVSGSPDEVEYLDDAPLAVSLLGDLKDLGIVGRLVSSRFSK